MRDRSTPQSNLPSSSSSPSPDPFLAQTRDIPLTQRDRQEGYDVELLRSQPRGSYQGSAVEGGGVAGGTASLGNNALGIETGKGTTGTGSGVGKTSRDVEQAGVGSTVGGEKYPAHDADSATPLAPSTRPRKKWYLRPLALVIIVLLILAIALGIGLGVGIGTRDRDAASSSSSSNTTTNSTKSTSSYTGTTVSRTSNITSFAAKGTVIPNTVSIDSFDTTTFIGSTRPLQTQTVTSINSNSLSTGRAPPASAASISGQAPRTIATSGNLPIPAGSSTIVGGMIISAISGPGDPSKRSLARETGRVRI